MNVKLKLNNKFFLTMEGMSLTVLVKINYALGFLDYRNT